MAYQGRVGVELDNLFCPTDKAKEEWGRKDPTLSFAQDNPFWGSLVPYGDIPELVAWLHDKDFYIFAERPKPLLGVTRGWLSKKCGLILDKEFIIMQALPRYDCRLRGIDTYISANPDTIENLKTETVSPITGYLVNREQDESVLPILEELDV